MALINCPECGREKVSDSAEACPDCGYGIKVHFDKIKLDKANIERQIQIEKEEKEKQLKQRQEQIRLAEEKRLLEIEEQVRREERIKNVPKPNNPAPILIGIVIGIIICAVSVIYIRNTNNLATGWMFFFIGLITVIASWITFKKQVTQYRLAKSNFERYQRTVIEKQEADLARQKAQYEEVRMREKLYEELEHEKQVNIPKCPTCGSTKLRKISGVSKVGSVAVWGVFAAGRTSKQWHCNNCGSEW